MKPSEICKQHGLTLKQLSEELGQSKSGRPIVSRQTLINWHRKKPVLFLAVVRGVAAKY
tara:strand:- start:65 stop:241 length:177 start_codon:yes stop_codon:yes gene_type:complete